MLGFGEAIELEAGLGSGRKFERGEDGTEFKSGAIVVYVASTSEL